MGVGESNDWQIQSLWEGQRARLGAAAYVIPGLIQGQTQFLC